MRYGRQYGYSGRIDYLYPREVGLRMKPGEHYLDYTGEEGTRGGHGRAGCQGSSKMAEGGGAGEHYLDCIGEEQGEGVEGKSRGQAGRGAARWQKEEVQGLLELNTWLRLYTPSSV